MDNQAALSIQWKLPTKQRRKHRPAPPTAKPAPVVAAPPPTGRLPRVTRLMALAIKFDGLLRDGVARDYADLARLGHVTRARMTQIMSLLYLAPDIEEALLFLPPVVDNRDPISERSLRRITRIVRWDRQRVLWLAMQGST